MAQVTIDLVQKNTDQILQIVGKESFINWDQFGKNSGEVAQHIDQLNNTLGLFRELQHKNFIQTMKKLKNYDLPDILQAVKSKRLPKQALRGVLTRFKLNGQKLELNDSVDSLKTNAKNQYAEYDAKNKQVVQNLRNVIDMLNKKINQSGGLMPQKLPQLEKIKSTVKFTISDDAATKLASAVDIQYLAGTNQLISFKTYSQLIDSTFSLIKDEYKSITQQARKKQRSNMKDHPEYFKNIHEYLNNCEALIAEGQSLLASKVGISEEKLGQSEMALMQKGLGQNVLMAQTQLRGKIKQSLKSDKDVSVQGAKEAIRYQVQMIDSKGQQIDSILSNLQQGPQTIQMVPMLLAIILNDYVFQKYGYQQEDYMKNLGEQIMNDAEFVKVFKDMESGIMKLMQRLKVIPPEVAEMMKQQQQYMQQMGGSMPPMGMPGVGMPGMGAMGPGPQPPTQSSNPLDMLQGQQMQQMQQMFQNMQPPPK